MTIQYQIQRDRLLNAIEKKYDELKKYALKPGASQVIIDRNNAFLSQLVEFLEITQEEISAQYIKGLDIGRRETRKADEPGRHDRESYRAYHELKTKQNFPNLY